MLLALGDSIQPADPIGKDAIRYRIPPKTGVFSRKTSRIRPRSRRNLCVRIPDQITSEKIRSVSVESDYRILSKPPESYAWRESYNAGFYNGSNRILSESGNRIPDRITPKKIRYNPSKSACRTTSDVAKYGV
jgi:hypothetical protein